MSNETDTGANDWMVFEPTDAVSRIINSSELATGGPGQAACRLESPSPPFSPSSPRLAWAPPNWLDIVQGSSTAAADYLPADRTITLPGQVDFSLLQHQPSGQHVHVLAPATQQLVPVSAMPTVQTPSGYSLQRPLAVSGAPASHMLHSSTGNHVGNSSKPVRSTSLGSETLSGSKQPGKRQQKGPAQRSKQAKEQVLALEEELEQKLACLQVLQAENSALHVKERVLRAMCDTAAHIITIAQQLGLLKLVEDTADGPAAGPAHADAVAHNTLCSGSSSTPLSNKGTNSSSASNVCSRAAIAGCLGRLQLPLPRVTTFAEVSVLRKRWVMQALDALLLVDSDNPDPILIGELGELHEAVEAQVYDFAISSYWTKMFTESCPDTRPIMEYDDPGDAFWIGVVHTMKFTAEQEKLLMACFEVYQVKMEKLRAKAKEAAERLHAAIANMPAVMAPGVVDTAAHAQAAIGDLQVLLTQQLHLNIATSRALDRFVTPLQRVRACCFSHPVWAWMLMVVDTFVKHHSELTVSRGS